MTDKFSFLTAFIFGLFGSTHCLGMCGGIISLLSFNNLDNKKIIISQLLYNLGRISSYGFIGFGAGFFGFILLDTVGHFLIKITKILSAIIIITLGIHLIKKVKYIFFLDEVGRIYFFVFRKIFNKLSCIKSPCKEFLLGLAWGNIPCGLMYSVVCWSVLSGSIYKSFLLMIAFGLGTIPGMVIPGTLYVKIKETDKKNIIRTICGIFVIIFGVYSLINLILIKDCHLLQ